VLFVLVLGGGGGGGWADSDGMMEGIPLPFFWNSLACIFWPDVLWIWKYVTCRESNDIKRGRKRTRRKKNYVQDTTVGEGITSNYAKIFQTMSAFVLMLYNDVTSTT